MKVSKTPDRFTASHQHARMFASPANISSNFSPNSVFQSPYLSGSRMINTSPRAMLNLDSGGGGKGNSFQTDRMRKYVFATTSDLGCWQAELKSGYATRTTTFPRPSFFLYFVPDFSPSIMFGIIFCLTPLLLPSRICGLDVQSARTLQEAFGVLCYRGRSG